jgi:predicted glycogen debranching enzyme
MAIMTKADGSTDTWRWNCPTASHHLPDLLQREWLETNGLGSFASSTVCGANTRRYHGVLIAATEPPVGRMVLVSKLDETLVHMEGRAELATNLYQGDFIHPAGYLHIESFESSPAPTWRFRAGRVTLEKSLAMIQSRQLTVVRYELKSARPADLEIRVLLAGRDYHGTSRANDFVSDRTRVMSGMVYVPTYQGVPAVWIGHQGHEFRPERTWYYRFDYPRERERGLEAGEDLISVGVLVVRLRPGRPTWLTIGADPVSPHDAAELYEREIASRRDPPLANDPDPLVRALGRATAPFLVRRGDGLRTVIAGYPWFTDWGRDTFISLPGLTLVTGRFDAARQILEAFTPHISEGMVPNRFGDAGGTEYNTIDATLWFVNGVYRYVCYTGDLDFVRGELIDALDDIVAWHERGTRFNVREDADGLLAGGADGVALTWMDAKHGDRVFTPRRGKPVEIAALWYNALRATAELNRRLGRSHVAERLDDKAARTRAAFDAQFWNPQTECLFDMLTDSGPDAAIRPNQLFAASLPFPVLDPDKRARVARTAERHLVTPLGLRSLAPSDPAYIGRFEGGPAERDGAYHQGTVWPWLLGPFVTASVRASAAGKSASSVRRRMREQIERLAGMMCDAGLGSICEVADGDPPHRPAGCYFQAWSVAEPLRALCEDVLGRES